MILCEIVNAQVYHRLILYINITAIPVTEKGYYFVNTISEVVGSL